ncbi:DEAD/DEAH box helicase [Dethiosulfatarculus sandiegensis]|jgi:ATP-dependent RNA helicase RhlE|uniref:DEAD/DEAH box helicase n=1 Tax=Dethiosulfatarculus sandiegensis TaxID=1429043 RepID=UPI000AA05BB1|nr:DEAD/DEAH box helicase [Dethiosulfatarculus sandiegensis]
MPEISFDQLALNAPIQRALRGLGYQNPTPIQAAGIPPILEGRDLQGCAQTGTGKTAAFALPILHKLSSLRKKTKPKSTRALVLTPTRELAVQVTDCFKDYGKYLGLHLMTVYGGVSLRPQIKACARGLDIMVATPGRLLDLINRDFVRLDNLEIMVLDEADRMLDMGFLPDIKRLLLMAPKERQTLFFSATMPPVIVNLTRKILNTPKKIQIARVSEPVEQIDQSVLFVAQEDKKELLDDVLNSSKPSRVLIFTRTKHSADKVARQLARRHVKAQAIHGNKSQNARQAALNNFRTGRTKVLVATDVASRGIDVEGVTHVINYDMPNEPESYVHRIGRTGRAGAKGVAISFCNSQERSFLRNIERLIRQSVPVSDPRAFGYEGPLLPQKKAPKKPYRPAKRRRVGTGSQNNPVSRKKTEPKRYKRANVK